MNRKLVKYLVSILLVVILSVTLYSCSKTHTRSGRPVTLTYQIYGKDICVTLPEEDAEKVIAMLDHKPYRSVFVDGVPSCGFDKNVSLKIGNRIYAIACDTCNTVMDWRIGRYFYIEEADMDYIHRLFQQYGGDFPCN